ALLARQVLEAQLHDVAQVASSSFRAFSRWGGTSAPTIRLRSVMDKHIPPANPTGNPSRPTRPSCDVHRTPSAALETHAANLLANTTTSVRTSSRVRGGVSLSLNRWSSAAPGRA